MNVLDPILQAIWELTEQEVVGKYSVRALSWLFVGTKRLVGRLPRLVRRLLRPPLRLVGSECWEGWHLVLSGAGHATPVSRAPQPSSCGCLAGAPAEVWWQVRALHSKNMTCSSKNRSKPCIRRRGFLFWNFPLALLQA